ncbi:hypothetical protein [Roseospira goensis]|uniref:Uncharacterized protein n=1 Tax=Roseospira goensis TaxID=391922 RepID=A0A7W6WLR4_9PROT|nr:hypothetical protein [Roseospira goensis]MBB4286697.1 hypothetical protein [Roseospira goensis]
MLRFLVFFRYGMTCRSPHIDDHVDSEQQAFKRRVLDAMASAAGTPKPAM